MLMDEYETIQMVYAQEMTVTYIHTHNEVSLHLGMK
jgi:hypothetical protein